MPIMFRCPSCNKILEQYVDEEYGYWKNYFIPMRIAREVVGEEIRCGNVACAKRYVICVVPAVGDTFLFLVPALPEKYSGGYSDEIIDWEN